MLAFFEDMKTPLSFLVSRSLFTIRYKGSISFGFSTEDMGFEPTHAVTRLPRFQHGLLSLLSNLPILTQIVYHKESYLAIKILEIRKMIDFERK